jgi:hypothetical protein
MVSVNATILNGRKDGKEKSVLAFSMLTENLKYEAG